MNGIRRNARVLLTSGPSPALGTRTNPFASFLGSTFSESAPSRGQVDSESESATLVQSPRWPAAVAAGVRRSAASPHARGSDSESGSVPRHGDPPLRVNIARGLEPSE